MSQRWQYGDNATASPNFRAESCGQHTAKHVLLEPGFNPFRACVWSGGAMVQKTRQTPASQILLHSFYEICLGLA
jgi:hypothetical protein